MNTLIAMTSLIVVPIAAVGLIMLRSKLFSGPRPAARPSWAETPQGVALARITAQCERIERDLAELKASQRERV